MNSRRRLGLRAISALAARVSAQNEQPGPTIYIHGLAWNLQLPAPMNDWLIRVDLKATIPLGSAAAFASLSDDFHDPVGSHVVIRAATLSGDQINLIGSITESKNASLVSQPVRINGRLVATSVEGFTVTIGTAVFSGAGHIVGPIIRSPPGPLIPIPFPNLGGTHE
jgi:hypothetical protein